MIVPIKCFTCGKVLGDLFRHYKETVLSEKLKKYKSVSNIDNTEYFTKQNTEKSIEGRVLDELYVKRACCRVNMLTHVEVE
jgi:DNA-directed RNA polymerase subunit N (RpoN/RPB10)